MAAEPTVGPVVDARHYLFSRRGSWLALYPADSSKLRLYDSHWSGARDKARWLDISFLQGEQEVETLCLASPSRLDVTGKNSALGAARVVLSGERDVLISTERWGLELRSVLASATTTSTPELPAFESLLQKDARTWTTRWRDWRAEFVIVEGTFSGELPLDWKVRPAPGSGRCRVAIRLFKDQAAPLPLDWKRVEAANLADWREFRRRLPATPARFVPDAERAWLNNWYSTAPATPPNFPTPPMLMARVDMNSIWPWDTCFNALALGISDLDAGLEQWMMPFHLQAENGQLPDKTGPEAIYRGCTKPPVQGWALGKLMDWHTIPRTKLEQIYPKLAKWTEFWFLHRDTNGNGIPGFSGSNPGWESGWDNSTVSAGKGENEEPELQAYLVLQMKTLARIADGLGRPGEAARWRERSATHLKLFRQFFWSNNRLITRQEGGKHIIEQPTSLQPMMSLILGESLDPDMFAALASQLDAYQTPYGLASEMPASPDYRSDPEAYWRGPIWAPAMLLVIDGLNRGGRRDLAVDFAQRFHRLIGKSGGYYENFHAQTGQGLKAKAYTWTSSVHVLLLHEYGAAFK